MNIQQVEQAPAPITEPLFEFLLHFTGLNPDRGSDLQARTSQRACSALAQPVLAALCTRGLSWGRLRCCEIGLGTKWSGKEPSPKVVTNERPE